jgi:N,N'-diacetyllegionaminate synthase
MDLSKMNSFKIGSMCIGEQDKCIISFEPGGTFQNIEEAKEMIKFSANAGADAIKFQTFFPGDADRIMGRKDITVDYTTPEGEKQELIYDALKRRELSKDEWKELTEFSKSQNLLFITAPYFPETVDFLKEINVDAIKVSKGDINNVLLIEQIAKTNIPVILDGREKFSDVETAIKICEKNQNYKILVMHCPSGYPAKNKDVNLLALKSIQEKYDYPVGFADHSMGGKMNYAAVALGAKMIEKTITVDKSINQVEHFMSLELNELKNFVSELREIEDALGNPDVIMESRVTENTRRSFCAKIDIKQGDKLVLEHLDFVRPGNMGIPVSAGFKILNKQAIQDIPKGTILLPEMISNE